VTYLNFHGLQNISDKSTGSSGLNLFDVFRAQLRKCALLPVHSYGYLSLDTKEKAWTGLNAVAPYLQ